MKIEYYCWVKLELWGTQNLKLVQIVLQDEKECYAVLLCLDGRDNGNHTKCHTIILNLHS